MYTLIQPIQYDSILPMNFDLLSILRVDREVVITQSSKLVNIPDWPDDIVDNLIDIIHAYLY